MSANTPLNVPRRMAQHGTARINSFRLLQLLKGIRNQIVSALRGVVGRDHQLVPIPVRTKASQRRDQRRSHD